MFQSLEKKVSGGETKLFFKVQCDDSNSVVECLAFYGRIQNVCFSVHAVVKICSVLYTLCCR